MVKIHTNKNVADLLTKAFDNYALWEVIKNRNSWVPIPITSPPEETGTSTTIKMTLLATIEEKTCKKNDVKAKSLLLMALPNEHQLTFDQYVDAQSMFAAIKARFGGNEATKKTQEALLKQQYENFSASSSESLDYIFIRLQKLVSRLEILGVVTPPEDLNIKNLRSLPSEWDTHVVVWMNKPNFDTMGLDDLYNNFKIVEQKVKRSVGASNDDKNLAFVTTSGASSTNNINTVTPEVSTATTKVNIASTEIYTASFSDATVYAFLSTQPKGSQLVHKDLKQLHDDDLEEMDLKWNMALLSMRARKAPRSKDNRNWNQGSSTNTVKIEDASEKAMCAIDGDGFDWSDMAEEEVQANMALMAFSDSEIKNDKSCSKNCMKNYEALKKQYDDLLVKLSDTSFKAATYKRDEQKELSVEEKAKLFQQLLEQRRKHFAANSAEEKRNKPQPSSQRKSSVLTTNMESKEAQSQKNKSFDSIYKMIDRASMRKVNEDKDTTELQSLMEVIPDKEEVVIDVVPLATKPPTIIDWKIHKEGKNGYFQIISADGSSKMYLVFMEDMDLLLWGDLKTMFESHVEDGIWKLQQRYKVLSWKLFDSCRVHCLSLQSGNDYIGRKEISSYTTTITDM
ncbi:hypothetical protein Tco_0908184 [Tanacetum coccineum]|uniref:Uncharacterized protein n=1 Tax=Tanacetum coccineum TaxID=301880 RepID=A0ABQ5CSW5_9ASTR